MGTQVGNIKWHDSVFLSYSPDEVEAHSHEVAPGISEQFSYRAHISVCKPSRPILTPFRSGRSSILFGGIAYLTLRRLEALRVTLSATPAHRTRFKGSTKRVFYGVRLSLAKRLLRPHLPTSFDVTYRLDRQEELWFEASRRILEVERTKHSEAASSDRIRRTALTCDVVTLGSDDANTSRLMLLFARLAPTARKAAYIYDPPSGCVMLWRPRPSLLRREHWEIVIAPHHALHHEAAANLEGLRDHSDTIMKIRRGQYEDAREIIDLDVEFNPSVRQAISEAGESAASEEQGTRMKREWEFVLNEIRIAMANGRPLDTAFVAETARKRTERAREWSEQPTQSDLGPTVSTSMGIVESLVDMYLVSIEESLSSD